MKTHLRLITAAALMILPGTALAQTDAHHPEAGASSTAPATPAPAPMTGNLPGQCTNMMPMMQQMMPMMQQMMQMMQGMPGGAAGMPMGGADMPMGGAGMPMGGASMSEAGKAYLDAMRKMDAPMIAAAEASDPDVAFVRAMIPHHQGAVDMARAVLQYGKDERVKEWANQLIKAQQAEIAEEQEWLTQRQ